MASKPSCASTLPWFWVIEALASFKKVDTSVLIDLVKKTPEISDDLGKITRETVSLRILEGIVAQQTRSTKNIASVRDSKIEFDSSEQCEHVLQRTLHEISSSNPRIEGPEILNCDFPTFITQKRAAFPKCTLHQLKDAILEGNCPDLAHLKERSGLSINNLSEKRILVDDGDFSAAAKRREPNCNGQTMDAERHINCPTLENSDAVLQEDSPSRTLFHSKRNRSDLDAEKQAAESHEYRINIDHGYDSHLHSAKKLKTDANLTSCQAVGQKSVPHQDLLAHEASGCNENCADIRASNVEPPCGISENISGNESRDVSDKSQLRASNSALLDGSHQGNYPEEANVGVEHNPGQEMSGDSDYYQDEKNDVDIKKRTFLSSQCTSSHDSLAGADCSELNLCMKCKKGGQLMFCSASACPLMIHGNCLVSAPSFDDSGNFYCPFCAYSRAISEYNEFQKTEASARKELANFIGLDNVQRTNKTSKRLPREDSNQLMLDDNVNGNPQATNNQNCVNDANCSQYVKNLENEQEVEPSASAFSGNLPCREEGATLEGGMLGILMKSDREGKLIGPKCQSGSGLERKQMKAQASHECGDDTSSCRDTETVHVTEKHVEDGMQQEDLQKLTTDSPEEVVCPPWMQKKHVKKETISPVEEHHTNPVIPSLRRKKILWTAVEEETLKEGVEKFAGVHDRWKRILDFGSDVFQKGRTPMDLKDKWRNISK